MKRALIVVAAMAMILAACSSSGGGGDQFVGYGKNAADVAKALGTCKGGVFPDGPDMAECYSNGGVGIVNTFKDSDVQGLTIAMLKDRGSVGCAVVLKGVLISSDNLPRLRHVLGGSQPGDFASKHGGHEIC